jgi:hypothetical protein
MFSKPPREACQRLHEAHTSARTPTRRYHRCAAAVSMTLITALATMPTASALASAGSSLPGGAGTAKRPTLSVSNLVTPGQLLSAGELQSLLATLPLNDLSAAQLAPYLAGLDSVSGLTELKVGLLGLEKKLGAKDLEQALSEAIEQLKLSNPSATLGELVNLKGPLEGRLGGLLNLLGLLLTPEQQAALESALGSLNLSSLNLDELVSSLLKSTKSTDPLAGELSSLAEGLFGELGAEHKLEGLLGGSELTSGFSAKTVKEVSEELNTTPKMVSEELGQTVAQLPETATMITAPLKNGQLAGVAPTVKGLVTGLLGDLGETPEKSKEEGSGKGSGEGTGSGSGEGKGSGSGNGEGGKGSGSGEGKGSGGSGGAGSGGSGSQTTVLVTVPGASTTPSASVTAKQEVGKVSILSHRVRGHIATVVLRVPSAGTATLAGKGVRGTRKQAARAEQLTLRVSLSRAASASLRHHRRLPVKLQASFHSTSGSSSSAAATVVFG